MSQPAKELHHSPAQSSLSVDEARAYIFSQLPKLMGDESVAIRSTLDRCLAETIRSKSNVPSHTNSAMDGYALLASDIPTSGNATLQLIGSALAGHPFLGEVAAGQCVRITTGAMLPHGCDTVVIQEHVELDGDKLIITAGTALGANVRQAGEDLSVGSVVYSPGHKLGPADIGVLASLGVPEVRVKRRVRVAFFSTGDELRSLGETLADGEIYDSNRYTLYSMLAKMGCEIIDMGVITDSPDAIRRAFSEASEIADMVLTSGGVSVGDADYVKMVLDELGEVQFWKINMKPGRPLAYGKVGNTSFFGLPGNPVAVMVTFYQFVRPAIRTMQGEANVEELSLTAKLAHTLKKAPGRMEFQRGIFHTNEHGELIVESTGRQGSGMLNSMSRANCFIVLKEAQTNLVSGDKVAIQPFINFF
ncbi:MAG: molybdopterin molybdotransferase MoeA [Gammaproteobacteria bacterium]|nr:molybdopterin molybdotransferase MoeA [Gammaproteobacteria bacterium]